MEKQIDKWRNINDKWRKRQWKSRSISGETLMISGGNSNRKADRYLEKH
jgi:hypothetical protein